MPPRIPLYNDTQVRPDAMPGVTVQAPRSELPAIGNALTAAGDSLGQIAKQEQDIRDADRLFRTEAQMRDDYLKYETALQTRRGQNAWGVTTDTEKWFSENGKKYTDGLENQRQQRLFAPKLEDLKVQSLGRAALGRPTVQFRLHADSLSDIPLRPCNSCVVVPRRGREVR